MSLKIIVVILGLIYLILFYAALPLGALALAAGLFQLRKASKDPEGRVPRAPTPEDIEAGRTTQSPHDDAVGLIWIGAILAVIGLAINAYHLLGVV